MDAKTKAEFINSVASGEQYPCPRCNFLNKPMARFCVKCGSPIEKPNINNESVKQSSDQKTKVDADPSNSIAASAQTAFNPVDTTKKQEEEKAVNNSINNVTKQNLQKNLSKRKAFLPRDYRLGA